MWSRQWDRWISCCLSLQCKPKEREWTSIIISGFLRYLCIAQHSYPETLTVRRHHVRMYVPSAYFGTHLLIEARLFCRNHAALFTKLPRNERQPARFLSTWAAFPGLPGTTSLAHEYYDVWANAMVIGLWDLTDTPIVTKKSQRVYV